MVLQVYIITSQDKMYVTESSDAQTCPYLGEGGPCKDIKILQTVHRNVFLWDTKHTLNTINENTKQSYRQH